jgi:hypothetical protein
MDAADGITALKGPIDDAEDRRIPQRPPDPMLTPTGARGWRARVSPRPGWAANTL